MKIFYLLTISHNYFLWIQEAADRFQNAFETQPNTAVNVALDDLFTALGIATDLITSNVITVDQGRYFMSMSFVFFLFCTAFAK